MTRRKPRGSHGAALFHWTAGGEIAPGEVTPNALIVACPTCRAHRGQPCTRPSRYGGRVTKVGSYHPARTNTAGDVSRETSPAVPSS